jgi:hypothetical protein
VMVTIVRRSNRPYRVEFGTIPLKEVAVHARPMDRKYLDESGMFVSKAFRAYGAPLVGELPPYASLKIRK